jgi:hypothetical protein
VISKQCKQQCIKHILNKYKHRNRSKIPGLDMKFLRSVEGKTRIRIRIRNESFREEVAIQSLFIAC